MNDALDRIVSAKAVAIVRAGSADRALGAARAALDGGMTAVEVTLNTPGALDVIRELAKGPPRSASTGKPSRVPHLVGAGTVLDTAAADAAIDAGARILVSPHTDPSLIRHVISRGALPIPGALTATEVHAARTAGAWLVKIFPAGCVGGPEYIRMLRGPFGDALLFPTGGVTGENMAAYLAAGAAAVGLTGWLFPPKALEAGDWDTIRARARQLVSQRG